MFEATFWLKDHNADAALTGAPAFSRVEDLAAWYDLQANG